MDTDATLVIEDEEDEEGKEDEEGEEYKNSHILRFFLRASLKDVLTFKS